MEQSEQAVRNARQERMENMRRVFLESTVRVVAKHGLERTTTKLISTEANLNEAYIYRCFENKEMLLRETFLEEDKRFVQHLQKILPVMRMEYRAWKERAFLLWQSSWAFMLEKELDCSFYYRYYYSASCQKYAYEDHLNCYRPLLEEIRGSFLPGTNISLLLHQLFATMLILRSLHGRLRQKESDRCWKRAALLPMWSSPRLVGVSALNWRRACSI